MLSQIKYKTEQFLLEFNRRYDSVKITYLLLLIFMSTAFLLSLFRNGPIESSGYDQMMTDLAIIENNIDEIQMHLDDIIEILEEKDAKQ